MFSTFMAMAVRPILLFFVMAFICLPVRFATKRWFPNGKLKRLLLTEVKQAWKQHPARAESVRQ